MMEFNQENVIKKLVSLRKEFGSTKKLAEASGMHWTSISGYINGRNKMSKKTWEKYFGPWETEACLTSKPEDIIVETVVEEPEKEIEKTEKPEADEQKEEPKSGFYVKSKSLAELKDILASLGMRLVVVNK